jgi:hypothetical protein
LLHRRKEILAVRAIPPELEVDFDETLKMHKASWNALWEALQDDQSTETHSRRERRIVCALARHRAKAPFVLRLLQEDFQSQDTEFIESIRHVLIELAGKMQIHAALPILFEGLAQGLDHLYVPVTGALLRLSKQGVVQEIIGRWPTLSAPGRQIYGGLLAHFHTNQAIAFGLKAFLEETKRQTRLTLAREALEHFAPETILPVYQYLLESKRARDDTTFALPRQLVTVAMVTGKRFDDFDAYLERMDRQYHREQELEACHTSWLADDYDELPSGPAPARRLSPQSPRCFLLKVTLKELGYLGRLRVPDLTLEELHEVLTVVGDMTREKFYSFRNGNRRFATGRGGDPCANPARTPLSEVITDGDVVEYISGPEEIMALHLKLLKTKDGVGGRVPLRFWRGRLKELSMEDTEGLVPRRLAGSAGKINEELRRIFR